MGGRRQSEPLGLFGLLVPEQLELRVLGEDVQGVDLGCEVVLADGVQFRTDSIRNLRAARGANARNLAEELIRWPETLRLEHVSD